MLGPHRSSRNLPAVSSSHHGDLDAGSVAVVHALDDFSLGAFADVNGLYSAIVASQQLIRVCLGEGQKEWSTLFTVAVDDGFAGTDVADACCTLQERITGSVLFESCGCEVCHGCNVLGIVNEHYCSSPRGAQPHRFQRGGRSGDYPTSLGIHKKFF